MLSHAVLALAVSAAAALVACEGCKGSLGSNDTSTTKVSDAPTVRFYLMSDVAGALEPCGCVKDQLGGLDHAAAFLRSTSSKNSALLSAGPLFFMDPDLRSERRAQELIKAETLATSMADLGLVAFAPSRNEWAGGPNELSTLTNATHSSLLLANAKSEGSWTRSMIREIGGIKVGLIGVASAPENQAKLGPISLYSSTEAVKREVDSLTAQGAKIIIAMASVGRGEAKRMADAAPKLTAILVGSSSLEGDLNDDAPSAERVGNVVIAQTSNHLQTIATLDFFVRGQDFSFRDGTGLDQGKKREDILHRIDDLRGKIENWEKDGKIDPKDLAARRNDLTKLEAEKKSLDNPAPPADGSFFRYSLTEIRESLGKDEAISAQLRAYYKKVNDANKLAFADKWPAKAAADQPTYAGVDSCTPCHAAARAVWEKTAHKTAYTTLSSQYKEFNLDCVSCHVTGYDKPGGSTVTHVEKLEAVQCEVCHGPSSKHVANPKIAPPVATPGTDGCLACHHPPHVHTFDAASKIGEILGPGHGMPLK